MRVRQAAAAFALLAMLWSPLAAQRTRDRPTLVFTVSGAYLDGTGLWTVPDQELDIGGPLPPDHVFLNRSIKRTFGASFAATYYKGKHFGLTGEAFLVGLGYDDACRILGTPNYTDNIERCQFIDERDRSAAAVAISARRDLPDGGARVLLAVLSGQRRRAGQQPESAHGRRPDESRLDPHRVRRRQQGHPPPAGVRARHRDHDRHQPGLSDPVGDPRQHRGRPEGHRHRSASSARCRRTNTVYKHLFSAIVGLDVVLERHRGRRY